MMRRVPVVVSLAVVCFATLLSPSGAESVLRDRTSQVVLDESPVDPGFPIEFVGVSWEGPDASFRIRFRTDATWGAWQVVEDDAFGGTGGFASPLIPGGHADALQVDLPEGVEHAEALVLQMADAADESADTGSSCGLRTRAEWGADESLRNEAAVPQYWDVQKLIVHHTGEPTPVTSPPEDWVRAIYAYHVQQGFDDVGYNFFVGPNGCIYEGRWSGDDGYPGHDRQGRGVQGAHVFGYNRGTIGISLLGNFDLGQPTPEAMEGLTHLLAELSVAHGLDPQRGDEYVDPQNGSRRWVMDIAGHRDYAVTECPGATVYSQMSALRSSASSRMDDTSPRSTFDGGDVQILIGEPVRGTSTDDTVGVHGVAVAFASLLGEVTTVAADLDCTSDRRHCSWEVEPPDLPGMYAARATATDRVGNAEGYGPEITVLTVGASGMTFP